MDRTRKIKDCIWTGSNSLRDQNWESDLPLPRPRLSLESSSNNSCEIVKSSRYAKHGQKFGRQWRDEVLRFKSRLNKDTVMIRPKIDARFELNIKESFYFLSES